MPAGLFGGLDQRSDLKTIARLLRPVRSRRNGVPALVRRKADLLRLQYVLDRHGVSFADGAGSSKLRMQGGVLRRC